MKHFLLCLLAFISYDLYSAAPAGVSGSLIASRFSSPAAGGVFTQQNQIDQNAKVRLDLLLDHEQDGLAATLHKAVASYYSLMQSDTQSLQQEQDRFRLKRTEFEQALRIAREDLVRKAIIVLKDFNVDAGGDVYERYLTHEYADAMDEKAQKAFDVLRKIESAALQEACKKEIEKAYAASRPLQLGSSLITNVVQDAREDFSRIAPVAGACALAMPYMPLKTREKVEEGVGSVIIKHPGSAAASLAFLFAGWQAVKYGTRYFLYINQASALEKQVNQELRSVYAIESKQPFVDQVPFILQSARESATIARLEWEVQSLVVSSARAQQLLEGQGISLQSLQAFAQAHGASLQDVRRIVDEVRAGQATYARGLLLMGKRFSEQQAALDAVAFDTQATREDVQAILRAVTRDDAGSQAAREHRSASDVACSGAGSVAGFAAAGSGMASSLNRVPSLGKKCRGLGVGPGSVYSTSRAGGQASSAPDASVKLQ